MNEQEIIQAICRDTAGISVQFCTFDNRTGNPENTGYTIPELETRVEMEYTREGSVSIVKELNGLRVIISFNSENDYWDLINTIDRFSEMYEDNGNRTAVVLTLIPQYNTPDLIEEMPYLSAYLHLIAKADERHAIQVYIPDADWDIYKIDTAKLDQEKVTGEEFEEAEDESQE